MNNVGVSYPYAEYYESIDDQLIDDLVTINIQATNKVCFMVPIHKLCNSNRPGQQSQHMVNSLLPDKRM